MSCQNFSSYNNKQTFETSASYTTYGDNHSILTLTCQNYSCSDDRLTPGLNVSPWSYTNTEIVSVVMSLISWEPTF